MRGRTKSGLAGSRPIDVLTSDLRLAARAVTASVGAMVLTFCKRFERDTAKGKVTVLKKRAVKVYEKKAVGETEALGGRTRT